MFGIIRLLILIVLLLPIQSFAKLITIDELRSSLSEDQKLVVAFDIDDTLLFSSPGFYYYANKHDLKQFKTCDEDKDFWYDVNNFADEYSLPKNIAFELIELHQSRGDVIYFITARCLVMRSLLLEL